MDKKPLVSIVAPFYNEGDGIEYFYQATTAVFDQLPGFAFEVVCVDDGSRDDTLEKLIALVKRDRRFRVVELSRNFGKEAALTAAIDAARGDAVIPIDADLQDPPELIAVLIEEWQKGAEIVLAHRADRSSDSFLKRKSAEFFYRIHNKISQIQIPQNVGDFRLLDRVVVDALKNLPERQRFMKGLFSWVGFKTTSVDYERNVRAAGETKFSGWKLWNLAVEGITSFSTVPLKLCTYVGVLGSITTLVYAIIIVAKTLIYGIDVPGYASLMGTVLFFSSIQLIGIGIVGEYVGRIYMETKQRPTYIVRKHYDAAI